MRETRAKAYMTLLVAFLCLVVPSTAVADEPAGGGNTAQKDHTAEIQKRVTAHYPHLDALYKHLHANPELSLHEEQTAARIARELKECGFDITEKIGGHGVVGILANGKGPTVLVRADMDALPIVESTGLPYASKVRTKDARGGDVGVMHACGHDVNMTCLVGTAHVLAGLKDRWQGTLVFVGQPAEEIGAGAKAMLADGLFKRFPRPDYCLALHADARYAHGHVNYRLGQLQANVDSVDITVRGRGGHGAAPQVGIDPIVLAARLILDLQTISSRERDPLDPVVVTVGSIHGGTKHNIIPDDVKLQLTVRTTTDATRKAVLASTERKTKAAAQGAGAPEPIIKVDLDGYTPALFNNPELGRKVAAVFTEALGKDRVHERPTSLGGEDFSHFAREGVPSFYFFVGSAAPELVAEAVRPDGRRLALTHSDQYFPVPEPTIQTGVLTMSLAVLSLMGK